MDLCISMFQFGSSHHVALRKAGTEDDWMDGGWKRWLTLLKTLLTPSKRENNALVSLHPNKWKKKELTALLKISETSLLPVREINLQAQKSKYVRQWIIQSIQHSLSPLLLAHPGGADTLRWGLWRLWRELFDVSFSSQMCMRLTSASQLCPLLSLSPTTVDAMLHLNLTFASQRCRRF